MYFSVKNYGSIAHTRLVLISLVVYVNNLENHRHQIKN